MHSLRTYSICIICKTCFGNLSSSYLFFHVVFPRFAEHTRRERTIIDFSVINAYLPTGERKEKKSQGGRDLENFTTTRASHVFVKIYFATILQFYRECILSNSVNRYSLILHVLHLN